MINLLPQDGRQFESDRSEFINTINIHADNAESFINSEFEKHINLWGDCVVTVLSIIQGNAQLTENRETIDGYVSRVESEVEDIIKKLEGINLLCNTFFTQPEEDVRRGIFEAIKSLKPRPEELL
jgi:hypothetical protein